MDTDLETEPERAPTPVAAILVAWGVFWILLIAVALQDHFRQGKLTLWQPILWEGSSFLVASLIGWLMWRMSPRNDRWLAQPRRWFAATLVWVIPAALGFVIVVYALRHGVYAALGSRYEHEPWPQVFRYETIKFSLFYLMFAAIAFGLRSHAAMGLERIKVERLRRLTQQAQLQQLAQQLAQQLEPHFLFNALNTIASTIHTNPDLADDLVQRLSSLLRAASDLTRRAEVTLAEELHLLQAYAAIMSARFGPRVRLVWDIDPAGQACRVPSLVLQPLLENAYRHAMEQAQSPMTITVHSRRAGDVLQLAVRDDQGVLGDPVVFGVGLSNLRQRLLLAYPGQASLKLLALAPRGVSAQIDLPCAY